jgi:N-acetylmuramoyl-L-alanine amidase
MKARILLPLVAAATLLAPASASAYFQHTIMPGESLSSIAATDGLSVAQLAAANGMSSDQLLMTGGVVQIPPQGVAEPSAIATDAGTTASAGVGSTASAAGAVSAGATAGATGGDYLVRPGDTLTAIAARAGTSIAAIAAANGLDVDGILPAGRRLTVFGLPPSASPTQAAPATTATASRAEPVSTTVASEPTTSTGSAETQPVGATAQGSATSPPYPTPERLSASQIASIAAANGVPSSLADAIAWQESGFNNDLVSSADARGIMQILPGTWEWIQHTLTPSAPLAPASAVDNVRGGVLLLRSLLNSTGDSAATAAAGYYQGLSSVQRDGLYSDTQQYVRSVLALQQRFGGG